MLTHTELLLPSPPQPKAQLPELSQPCPRNMCRSKGGHRDTPLESSACSAPLGPGSLRLQPPATVMLHRTELLEHLCTTKTPFHHIALKRVQQISFLGLKATCASQQRIQIQVQPLSFLSIKGQVIYKAQLGKARAEINFPASPPSVPSHLHIRL